MANYTYEKETGITLQAIKTSPNNIVLLKIGANVTATNYYGVNGGFFFNGDLLSIAVNNDVPVCGVKGDYGSGWFNAKYPRGTLVWDKVFRKYSVQVVSSADEIVVADRNSYWAQGGISMSLQDDDKWRQIATEQNMPNMDGLTTRTAVAFNSGLNIYLIVTETQCTAAAFRQAIKGFANGTIIDGVFLDSGGSSQLKAWGTNIDGDGRKVVQMIALINK